MATEIVEIEGGGEDGRMAISDEKSIEQDLRSWSTVVRISLEQGGA